MQRMAMLVSSSRCLAWRLFAAADEAKLTNNTNASNGTTDAATGARCSSVAVARVLKGASVAKCQANIDNTTLYPIRVKLLV